MVGFLSCLLHSFLLLLHFACFALAGRQLFVERGPGPGQVVRGGAELAHVPLRVGVRPLGRGAGLAGAGARRVVQQVGVRVGPHGGRTGGSLLLPVEVVVGLVDVLAAQVGDGVAAAVGHDDVVPGAQGRGGEVLGPARVLLGPGAGRHDHGLVRRHRLHGALEGLEDAVALLLLLFLPGLGLAQLPPVVLHHLLAGVRQPPVKRPSSRH